MGFRYTGPTASLATDLMPLTQKFSFIVNMIFVLLKDLRAVLPAPGLCP